MRPLGQSGIVGARLPRTGLPATLGRTSALSLVIVFALIASLAAAGPLENETQFRVLSDDVLKEGLLLMAEENYLGLGAEAAQVTAWIADREAPVSLDPLNRLIRDRAGRSLTLTHVMATTLDRLNQWYSLKAPADHPITHEQLSLASLSPTSVRGVQAVFESAIRRGIRMGGRWIVPEVGGEATIAEDLRLVESVDSRWSTVQGLAQASSPAEVARFSASHPTNVAEVDTHQLLRLGLERLRLGFPGAADEVRRAVVTIAENTAASYSHDPEAQFALIAGTDWSGRYVGRWHTHSPRESEGRWVGGEPPSFEDMENAVRDGQYLTLVFQPGGFDLYDAEALADAGRVDLSLMKVIRHRSPAWRDHFQALLSSLNPRASPEGSGNPCDGAPIGRVRKWGSDARSRQIPCRFRPAAVRDGLDHSQFGPVGGGDGSRHAPSGSRHCR